MGAGGPASGLKGEPQMPKRSLIALALVGTLLMMMSPASAIVY
ncbi:MAG: hypothetical protein ACRDKF_11965 [Actinomycetota bacterium]